MPSSSPKVPRDTQTPTNERRRGSRAGSHGEAGDGHEGATEEQVGDRRGSGPGYDKEPKKIPDKGVVET